MSERETFFELFDFLKKEAYVFCNRRKGRNGKLRYCRYASTDEEDGSVSCRLRQYDTGCAESQCKMWYRNEAKRKGRK